MDFRRKRRVFERESDVQWDGNEAGLRTLRAFWKLTSRMTGTADDEEGGEGVGAASSRKGGPAQCYPYGL